jgi:replicative DNA helicase
MRGRDAMEQVPYDERIEMAALGAMIGNDSGAMLARAEHGLRAEMFYRPAHHSICTFVFALADSPKWRGAVDPMMLSRDLREAGLLEEIGGVQYLMECAELAPIPDMARGYFEKVKDLYERREVIRVAREVAQEAAGPVEDGFLMQVPQRFHEIMPQSLSRVSIRDSLDESLQRWQQIEDAEMEMPGISTGFGAIDNCLGGLQPGFHVLGARPSAGKTSLEGHMMTNMARRGVPVARVCMDMTQRMLLERDACRLAGVSLPKLNKHFAGAKNVEQVREAATQICGWPMHVLAAEYEISKICSWLRLMKLRHDLQVASVDYVQLCRAEQIRSYDPVRVIGYCSAALKELGQELGIPILVLAQLNRDSSRDRRRPTLADLKGCGDLEQHATTCILLSKEERFDYELHGINEVTQRAIWCEVAKNQQGGVGLLEMWFHTSYFKMEFAPKDWGVTDPFGKGRK